MPWQLTTPLSVGDLDSAAYQQAKIVDMRHDSNRSLILLTVEYGNTVNDEWQRGHKPADKQVSFVIDEQAYIDLVISAAPDVVTSDPSSSRYVQVGAVWVELTYEAVKRGLYEYLADQGDIPAGSVV